MSKPSTFPDLYDECRTITITKLKEWKYLKPDVVKQGTISWSRNEVVHSRIDITVNTFSSEPYVELDYKCNNEPIRYKVYLISKPTNINKGVQWFFVCPNTGKHCRKLYMISTYFLHRTAFKGAMYEKQTYSKRARDEYSLFAKLFNRENAYETIYSKYFTKFYKGKPTKRYLRIWKKTREASEIDISKFYF